MSAAEIAASDQIEALAADVAAGRIGKSKLWGGADIVIALTPPTPAKEPGFYPDPRSVVTPHAAELSWLFEKLRGTFAGVLDHMSKHDFYERLAGAADRFSGTADATQTSTGLLLAVLDEARQLVRCVQPNRPRTEEA